MNVYDGSVTGLTKAIVSRIDKLEIEAIPLLKGELDGATIAARALFAQNERRMDRLAESIGEHSDSIGKLTGELIEARAEIAKLRAPATPPPTTVPDEAATVGVVSIHVYPEFIRSVGEILRTTQHSQEIVRRIVAKAIALGLAAPADWSGVVRKEAYRDALRDAIARIDAASPDDGGVIDDAPAIIIQLARDKGIDIWDRPDEYDISPAGADTPGEGK